jgi:hypothetical protein
MALEIFSKGPATVRPLRHVDRPVVGSDAGKSPKFDCTLSVMRLLWKEWRLARERSREQKEASMYVQVLMPIEKP